MRVPTGTDFCPPDRWGDAASRGLSLWARPIRAAIGSLDPQELKVAATRTYNVTLTPATVGDGLVTMRVFDPRTKKCSITASSLTEMLQKVRAEAKTFGETCSAYVSVPRGERKPPGFDKAVRTLGTAIVFEPELATTEP